MYNTTESSRLIRRIFSRIDEKIYFKRLQSFNHLFLGPVFSSYQQKNVRSLEKKFLLVLAYHESIRI